MPHLPSGANASILANFPSSQLLAWMEGSQIPERGPHTEVTEQYGCTINRDFAVESTRSNFKKGMSGCWIEKMKGHVKI